MRQAVFPDVAPTRVTSFEEGGEEGVVGGARQRTWSGTTRAGGVEGVQKDERTRLRNGKGRRADEQVRGGDGGIRVSHISRISLVVLVFFCHTISAIF